MYSLYMVQHFFYKVLVVCSILTSLKGSSEIGPESVKIFSLELLFFKCLVYADCSSLSCSGLHMPWQFHVRSFPCPSFFQVSLAVHWVCCVFLLWCGLFVCLFGGLFN